jgi:hypothetical protein
MKDGEPVHLSKVRAGFLIKVEISTAEDGEGRGGKNLVEFPPPLCDTPCARRFTLPIVVLGSGCFFTIRGQFVAGHYVAV